MPNGHPPVCDPACQKIILNSGNILALSATLRKRMKTADPNPSAKIAWDEISVVCDRAESCVRNFSGREQEMSAVDKQEAIALLNHHENEVCRVQAIFLKAVGYDGPTGKMLQ